MNFDTEQKNSEKININAYEGVFYENPSSKYSGIIWNDENYIFNVEGNVSKEELIKIAKGVS